MQSPVNHPPDHPGERLGRSRTVSKLIACGLLLGVILAGCVAWYGIASRRAVIDDAVREMRNDALMLAEAEDRMLQAVDIVHGGLIEHMRAIGIDTPDKFARLMGTRDAWQNLRDRVAGLSWISALSLLDSDGALVNFSRTWPPPPLNASRDMLNRDGAPPGANFSAISKPLRSDVTGKWTIWLTRRFDAPDGTVIGYVSSTIQIGYFEQFYARLPLTGAGSFVLYRRDGMLLARYPHLDLLIGESLAGVPNFARVLAADGGMVRQISMFDGQDRLIVPHALAHYPLVVTVSDTMDSVLAAWCRDMRMIVLVATLLELLIAGIVILATRQLRDAERLRAAETARVGAEAGLAVAEERERAARALRLQEQRYDAALNNMAQGVCMFDEANRVVVANRRFYELSGVPDGSVLPGLGYAELIELVIANGLFRREDMDHLRDRRRELIAAGAPTAFAWDLTDGRSLMVNHRPLRQGWLATYEDITERRQAEARIAHMARYDALTDLGNRVLLRETLQRALRFARRGHLLALHCLDLDRFKRVNDTLGHPIGDRVLREVARRLSDAVRETDFVARHGGDEFTVVQTAIDSPLDATTLAARMIALLEQPFEIDGHQIMIGVSIGVAFAPDDGLDAEQLLKHADLALSWSKAAGRGVYRLFQAEMDAAMQARRQLEIDLREAITDGQLELFFQPKVDVRARRIAGCEALLRWRHPRHGWMPPDSFIPLAEETALIVPIGDWVLRQACAAATRWPWRLNVAVNVSAVQFRDHDLVASVATALRDSGLAAERLELEITESVMLHDTDVTLATLHRLRALGVGIAMDDFGTGYSSLGYLRRFPFDRIKIDKSFISELGLRDDCIAIVRAVIALGRDLGMAITAEGVETRDQLETLEQAGCGEIQGFLFSRPVPEAAVPELLRSLPTLAAVWPGTEDAPECEAA